MDFGIAVFALRTIDICRTNRCDFIAGGWVESQMDSVNNIAVVDKFNSWAGGI